LRDFKAGEVITRELFQFGLGRGCAHFEDNKSLGRLAPFLVRHTYYGRFLHRRMSQERSFDFHR
jgi:hypothetical protein